MVGMFTSLHTMKGILQGEDSIKDNDNDNVVRKNVQNYFVKEAPLFQKTSLSIIDGVKIIPSSILSLKISN